MTTHAMPVPARPPARGFRELMKVEAKIALRMPLSLALGVLLPVIFLVILGASPEMKKLASGSTLTMFSQYIPVLIGMSLGLIALISLPTTLVTNRQMGVLRRFATTPAPPAWLLAAQLIINAAVAVMAIIILVGGGVLFFGARQPSQWPGFVLSALLATAAMFAIGLLITAISPSTAVAGIVGTVLLYPLLFFAGMWTPTGMSPLLQHIGDYTPLGAAVQAMDAAMQGSFPPARPLLVMAVYAVVFSAAAIRWFRWE